jgi:hypothetical protein
MWNVGCGEVNHTVHIYKTWMTPYVHVKIFFINVHLLSGVHGIS